jgi:hypothetical protein
LGSISWSWHCITKQQAHYNGSYSKNTTSKSKKHY